MLISIIIPTFNRADQLNRTLFSLVELKTPKHLFEIIIVDNGSTDKTKEVIEKYINQNKGFTIKYFYDDIPGLLTGRHRGAKEAKGEILTFIDDDILVSETWLNTIYSVMSSRVDIGFLTGPNLPLYESYPPTWLNYFWSNHQYGKTCGWLSLLDFGNEIKEISPNYVWGLNFTVRKNVFQQLGGFHPDNISKEFQHFQGDGETGLTLKAIEQSIKVYISRCFCVSSNAFFKINL
ncbi:MAG: glycosyltransferase family 2 protein [Chitinophagales bacterium]|nr:glycosyltransferase family 2 protein [Chitinophagales bacterium]